MRDSNQKPIVAAKTTKTKAKTPKTAKTKTKAKTAKVTKAKTGKTTKAKTAKVTKAKTTKKITKPKTKRTKVICISHKEDADGISSAALIRQAFGGDAILVDYPAVSYTHLTLPTNREV